MGITDELRAKDVLDQLGAIVLVVAPDGMIVYGNEAAVFAYGYSLAELTKLHISEIREVSGREAVAEQLQRATEGGVCFEAVHRRADGRTFAVEVNSRPLSTTAGTVLISLVTDITGRSAAQEALRESEERFRLLAENSTDVMVRLVVGGVISWLSPSVTDLLGWDPGELVGMRFVELVHPDDHDRFFAGRSTIAVEGDAVFRYRARSKDGTYRWVESHAKPYLNAEGEREGVLAIIRSVDAQVHAGEMLKRVVRCDELTEVLERGEAIERLRIMAAEAAYAEVPVTVFYFDVDHLDEVNESHGRTGGDALLRRVARGIKGAVRRTDLVGRVGPDEFLVAMVDVPDTQTALRIAEKVHLVAIKPFEFDGDILVPSVSIGVTVVAGNEDIDVTVGRARETLADAKRGGPDRIALG
jgi:diguanylate cyclase (GGDEF)-like protein/PAS domain S-box-containing protein